MFAGVEQDGVGGFGADATKSEQLLTEHARRCGKKATERPSVAGIEKGHKGLESLRFLPEVTGGADRSREPRGRYPLNRQRRQQLSRTEIGDGALDVFPRSVLGEDGAKDDLEAGTARPPVLRTIGGKQGLEVGGKGRIAGRYGERAGPRARLAGTVAGLSAAARRAGRRGDNLRQHWRKGHRKGTITVATGQVKKGVLLQKTRNFRANFEEFPHWP